MVPKASFHTLGCRLNQAETAIMAKSLKSAGYEIVDFGHSADVTVINTCTVTEQADAKCRQVIRKSLRISADTIIVVVGCYAQMAVDVIKGIKGVDLIVGNEQVRVVVSGKYSSHLALAMGPTATWETFITKRVELPANWGRLVKKYQNVVPRYVRY